MGWIGRRVKAGGIAVSDKYARGEAYFDLTPAGLTLIRTLGPLIEAHVRGMTLDAGAGRLTYHDRLLRVSERVISFDRYRIRAGLDLIGDLCDQPFPSSCFDSIFCSQVLEHVPDPQAVLREFARVLRPGGVVLLSAPQLAYLHNEPHDYFRYTEYGLSDLCAKAGLEVCEVRWSGGLLSFLGHLPSTFAVNLAWGVPLLFPIVFQMNRIWTRCIAALEKNDGKVRRFALNIAVVARKGT